jgi:hypothetical protein
VEWQCAYAKAAYTATGTHAKSTYNATTNDNGDSGNSTQRKCTSVAKFDADATTNPQYATYANGDAKP